jgi:hydrogenase maturation protease
VSPAPTLVVGLGNPLAGDDGVGCRVAEALARDPELPEGTEVVCGGTDLLRLEDRLRDRAHVIVLDALLDDGSPGQLRTFGPDPEELRALVQAQGHAHHLSAAQALVLLRSVAGTLEGIDLVLLGITVRGAAAEPNLSAELADAVPRLAREVCDTVRRITRPEVP